MKRILSSILISFVAVLTVSAQNYADRQSLTDPQSQTMILLGDPQGYVKYKVYQPFFDMMTAWIADNVENLNIKAVLCVGDLVDHNDNNILNLAVYDQTSAQMWDAVSKSFENIDGLVPHIHSPGNHDYGFIAAEDEHTYFPDHFPVERHKGTMKTCLVAQYPNREGRASLENAAFEFTMNGWSKKILVISSEFYPSNGALQWAKNLCLSERFKDHYVIYMTHSYLTCHGKCNNARIGREGYPLSRKEENNSGVDLWEKLFSKVPNIRLVLCGHHAHADIKDENGNDRYDCTVGWRVDKNDFGYNVHQMMFDMQTLNGGWAGNGGDGWLRILEFMPDGKTVKVRTYSPLFGYSNVTKHLAHRTADYDQFDFTIE
jgi:hypothetical protein